MRGISKRIGELTLVAAACVGALRAQGGTGTAAQVDREKAQAEIGKLNAETDKLKAETSYYQNTPWLSLAQNAIAFTAIVIPIIMAIKQFGEQRKAQQERARTDSELLAMRARVDASLKAAEIAVDAPTTGLVRSRVKILSALLKDLAPDFGSGLENLDWKKFATRPTAPDFLHYWRRLRPTQNALPCWLNPITFCFRTTTSIPKERSRRS